LVNLIYKGLIETIESSWDSESKEVSEFSEEYYEEKESLIVTKKDH
jgi:hypothetical protein